MAAVALYVVFYYSKFLARMDYPHAYEPFMFATPLMLYIVYRAFSAADGWVRSRLPARRAGWITAHPVAIVVLIFFVVLFWGPLHPWSNSRRPIIGPRPQRRRPTPASATPLAVRRRCV